MYIDDLTLNLVLEFLQQISDFYWDYIGFNLLISFGLYTTFKTNFFQFRVLKSFKKQIKEFIKKGEDKYGIHPIKLYFSSIGGSVGLGNIIAVSGSLIIGGPGAVFWLWVASFAGMLVKYSEIFLGVKYRVKNKGEYDGGPMYFLVHAFPSQIPAFIVAFLLCIYGVEVFQFSVITKVVATTYNLNYTIVLMCMVILVFYSAVGGVKRLSNICTILMPIFMILYIILCLIIIILSFDKIPGLLGTILKSAFTGHAAVGGFAGSTMMLGASQGIQRAVYSGDIGIGYDAIIQSTTQLKDANKQARFSIFALFSDTVICFLSMMIALCSGCWTHHGITQDVLVTKTMMIYFPYAEYLMSILLFLAGFTTVIAYLTIGYKSVAFISRKFGFVFYTVLSFCSFVFFGLYTTSDIAFLVMQLIGGLLMMFNLAGIIKLRSEIKYQ